MVKVVKFGGSSLASAEQFAKVGNIFRSDESRKFVVPSAPGKRNSKDTKRHTEIFMFGMMKSYSRPPLNLIKSLKR